MTTGDDIERLRLRMADLRDSAYEPHPRASSLVLPDGSAAPEAVRLWASLDTNYPTYLSARRSEQAIATPSGEVIARPMHEVLREVCIEDVRDELEDDEDTLAYLEELVETFSAEFPCFGVRLEPHEHPDRLVWFDAKGEATVLWYENDAFEEREPFARWVLRLFEDDT